MVDEDKKVIEDMLFIKEEDKKMNVKEITGAVKPFLRIDPESKNILFINTWTEMSNYEKIAIVLAAKYLGNIAGVFSELSMSLPEICERMGGIQTTLSAPLNRLIKEKFVIALGVQKKREYKINEITIKSLLIEIKNKYIDK